MSIINSKVSRGSFEVHAPAADGPCPRALLGAGDPERLIGREETEPEPRERRTPHALKLASRKSRHHDSCDGIPAVL
ncbi:hypothetical protein AMECASPLE_024617 [Ameca splendens]|uniref:Uncharacterized protein n=1 Tax=Ameca splendens TaxID=208324 RepID=A0ABV0Y4C2_9TELE